MCDAYQLDYTPDENGEPFSFKKTKVNEELLCDIVKRVNKLYEDIAEISFDLQKLRSTSVTPVSKVI